MLMTHRLLVGAVSLVPGRVHGDIAAATRARDEVGELLIPSFLEGAPFEQISLILRYGEETNLSPVYLRTKSGTLDIAVELEMAVLRKAHSDEVYRLFRQAILAAVIAVAEKYGLPCQELCRSRAASKADEATATCGSPVRTSSDTNTGVTDGLERE